MQIQYYQNHYSEYLNDVTNHLREKDMMRSNLERHTADENNIEKKANADLDDLPPSVESLTQLVSASTTSSSLFVSFKEFYIREFDFIDLYKEYTKWLQIGDSPIGYSIFLATIASSCLTIFDCYL